MANPRKFSEKIALHNQKQAEETAAFERIMQEVSVTRQPQRLHPHPQAFLRPSYLGGSLPNVNQMSGPPMEMQMRQGMYEDFKPPHMRHQVRFDSRPRPYRRPDFQNRHPRHVEGMPGGPYSGPYLSPPADTSWRSFALSRTNSDSALHQSVMNPNSQAPFSNFNNVPGHLSAMPQQPRRDLMDTSMSKSVLDAEKFHQHLQAPNGPKSCEDSHMGVLQNTAECTNHRQGMPPTPTNQPGLSHVTQIGNNTGSLPDLTNLHIPSPLPNPIDYDEQQKQMPQNQQGGSLQTPASMLYNQARSTGNINSASNMNPHIGGGLPSPNRSRRHTHNGPSPLSLSSQEQNRRVKFHGIPSPKIVGIKPDLKSPPIGGPYSYAYPLTGPGGPGPLHRQMQQHLHQAVNSAHPVLRVDVNAASKVGQYPNPPHPQQIGGHRHSSGPNMTSPITSPTSPTSHGSLSPSASPQHLPELTSTTNPALSEAYYRTDLTSMQPLQHQFEQFHVVGNDIVCSSGLQHTSMPPPVYSSSLHLLSGDGGYGAPQQRSSDSSIHTYNNGSNNFFHKNLISPTSKIPDIVFTGVDDPQKSGLSGEVPGYPTSVVMSASGMADFGNDYFPGDDLKVNIGFEELQMLDAKMIEDPLMEDDLRLNSS
uniref:CREB-regulated transcription coactivator 1-like isoform X1 n=1 Tax=Styela clava TaxID=7725 RepID=UPI0019394EAD|nr:CREB-regulated transcription coactivator 1-like isoform X1 [Styela clava]